MTYLMMSIKPKYADKILDGSKTIELRKVRPRNAGSGDLVVVYASSPKKSLVGLFEIADIMKSDPKELWRQARDRAGVEKKEFEDYFTGTRDAYGISIGKTWWLKSEVSLSDLKKLMPSFTVPQSFCYLSEDKFKLIVDKGGGIES